MRTSWPGQQLPTVRPIVLSVVAALEGPAPASERPEAAFATLRKLV